jgi:hypothetical protein
MIRLLLRFLDICLLRLAPQDMPCSSFLLGLSLLMYAGLSFTAALLSLPVFPALILALFDAGLIAGLLWILLWIRDLLNRMPQTLIALYGSGTVMQLIALPVVLWQNSAVAAPAQGVAAILLWLWLLWHLVVIGHVLRHAVQTILPLGTLLALLYLFVSFSVTRTIFFSGG